MKENLLIDEDLRSLPNFSCEELNLSANFFRKPNIKSVSDCEFINFSYNPIDITWLSNQNLNPVKGLSLIGCFELQEGVESASIEIWEALGRNLSNLKKLKISFLPPQIHRFLTSLCNGALEENEFFAIEGNTDTLVELGNLEGLKVSTFTSCTFNRNALEGLVKVLKRTFSLEILNFHEIDFEDEEFSVIEEGIKGNFSLKQVNRK